MKHSVWRFQAFLYSVKDAKKHIKANKEYCIEGDYSMILYVKRTEAELEKDQREEQRSELKQRYQSEAREINQTTRELRNSFITSPPTLSKEQYQILIKEFVRALIHENWRIPDCLEKSKSNFDSVYEKDSGVKIILEIIRTIYDKPYFSNEYPYISMNIDKPRNICEELNTYYYLLTRLGYEMTDEEIQLRDGTHPIFSKYKESKGE